MLTSHHSAKAETPLNLQRPCVALVPAAGVGSRFAADSPKQYCLVLGQPMIVHTVSVLLNHPGIDVVYVAVVQHDRLVTQVLQDHPKLRILACGGATRQDTVFNALQGMTEENPWVLVHDAARPGLTNGLINRLLSACADHPVGGLLAMPIVDTLKQDNRLKHIHCSVESVVLATKTVSRQSLWAAQTPQMFKRIDLLRALALARQQGLAVTDESSAMEAMGLHGCLVQGSMRNWKISYADDLSMVEALIKAGVE